MPIGDVKYNKNGDIKTINLGRYSFNDKGNEKLEQSAEDFKQEVIIDQYYKESYQEILDPEANTVAYNLEEFISKAKKSNGYYIGRFEVGDAEAEIQRTEESLDTVKPVIKKGKWPYNFVSQPTIAGLIRQIYNKNDNFQSDLVNSYAWDTAIVYIQKFSGDNKYSMQTSLNNILVTTGNAHDENNNYDVRCKIYDMGGNPYEWSTETSLSGRPCTNRGGTYMFGGRTGDRYPNSSGYSYASTGFRPILYV